MTQPPNPPYGGPPPGPYGNPPPYPGGSGPRRLRPRARWFVIGGVLLVLAPVVFGVGLFLTLRPLAQEDAVVRADGQPHLVELPAREERALFVDRPVVGTACQVVDGAGNQVDLRPVGGDFTFNEWTATDRFDTADGDLTITCTGDGRVRVGALPSIGGFAGGLAVAILAPLLLGLTGLVMLVVTGILYATGAPRPPRS